MYYHYLAEHLKSCIKHAQIKKSSLSMPQRTQMHYSQVNTSYHNKYYEHN